MTATCTSSAGGEGGALCEHGWILLSHVGLQTRLGLRLPPAPCPHCRWEWLEAVLARIAALNGNVTAWRQLAVEEYILHVG